MKKLVASKGQCFSLKVGFLCGGDVVFCQCFQWGYDFLGIFQVGPPSHSGFLKINGINLPVTFPARIQVLGIYARLAGMECLWHAWRLMAGTGFWSGVGGGLCSELNQIKVNQGKIIFLQIDTERLGWAETGGRTAGWGSIIEESTDVCGDRLSPLHLLEHRIVFWGWGAGKALRLGRKRVFGFSMRGCWGVRRRKESAAKTAELRTLRAVWRRWSFRVNPGKSDLKKINRRWTQMNADGLGWRSTRGRAARAPRIWFAGEDWLAASRGWWQARTSTFVKAMADRVSRPEPCYRSPKQAGAWAKAPIRAMRDLKFEISDLRKGQ
ncbi:MAG TPA: hypothetical protein VG347_21740 [Verrucomicrobiae bacterium]|nr:hypothetical protein [Verrucomicrobiae bacterium]